MKANELRIGNLVDLGNRIAKVIEINHLTCVVVDLEETQDTIEDYERSKSIPLTEKWLLKFGFRKNKDKRWMRGKSRYAIFYFEYYATGEDNCMWRIEYHDTDYGRNEYKDCNQWGDRIKYVHQLQNLYWSLTGEELTIKC
jgi:hypothetical protein